MEEKVPPSGHGHVPVLLEEALESLITDPAGLYLDATLGLGGHSQAIIQALDPAGRLLGIDLDPETLEHATKRLEKFGPQFKALQANFRNLPLILEAEKFFPLSGALFDLGVSSLHFDKPERGFSIKSAGPLDMRLSPENPLTAETIVNRWPPEQLELLLKEFGEEPLARRIALAIARRRSLKPITQTTELAEIVASVAPRSKTHPATRTFMALRIAVNAELENLTRGLEGVLHYLKPKARLVVISFHSLEDRIVKELFASFVSSGLCRFASHGRGAVVPSPLEVEANARARSARLRAVEKL